MTYLATEMLLYLLSTAAIGLVLGWLIFGGNRRKLKAQQTDLKGRFEAEIAAHQETRQSLDRADEKTRGIVDAAKADAMRSIAELQKSVEQEREKAAAAEAALDRIRAEMEETVQKDRASGRAAIDEAMRAAEMEKAAAADAMAREARSRAQIEELRLLIGAEKLAAENARAELQEMRAELQSQLETERAAHRQVKTALDDIRSTLARTLGADALSVAAGDGGGAQGRSNPKAAAPAGPFGASRFSLMTDMASAGDALNNPDLDEADIEDREDTNLELSPDIDDEPKEVTQLSEQEPVEVVDPPIQPKADRIELRPLPSEPAEKTRPSILIDQRPDEVDDLKAIDGIGADIEQRLNDKGCYHYRQIAALTAEDIDWLAAAIDVTPGQIAADRWVPQAKALERVADAEGESFLTWTDPEDRTSTG